MVWLKCDTREAATPEKQQDMWWVVWSSGSVEYEREVGATIQDSTESLRGTLVFNDVGGHCPVRM